MEELELKQIEPIYTQMQDYFAGHPTYSLGYRLEALRKLLAAIEDAETEVLAALKSDLGRSDFESYAAEIGFTYSEIRQALSGLSQWMEAKPRSTPLALALSKSVITPVPLGTVLIIAPWNYPFQLTMAPLIAALAAGNCALIKPSELAPATAEIIQKILAKTFPPQYVAVVCGGVAVTQKLLALKWNHIFFTGSTAVGKIVAKAAAENLTPVTLELGGKSPCIVHHDINMDVAAKRIVWGKFLNCGQTCIAPDYILVHRSKKQELIENLKKHIKGFYGNSVKESQDYGRIINTYHMERLQRLLQDQKIILGGDRDLQQKYFSPVLVDEPPLDSALMQEEIFGPILPIIAYDSLADIEKIVDRNPEPLSLYLFTKDKELQNHINTYIRFGGGCVNNTLYHFGNGELPFGGVGTSGLGAYHGEEGFLRFSHQKAILKSSIWPDLPVRYAPYKNKLGLLRFLLRWTT